MTQQTTNSEQALAPVTVLAPITSPDDGRSINAFSSESAFITAQRMAKALASSSLVPKEYQNNIPNVMIAMELAARIGASPFAVMQNIDIIHGRPSWRSTFLIATVNACGRFTPLRFRFQGDEGKPTWGCRAYATDRETGEECVGSLITLALAKAEGWTSKSGSKWLTIPEQMLMYRAAAFWTRVYAPELSLGMHTRDEVEDMMGGSEVVKPARGSARTKVSALAEKRAAMQEAEASATAEPEEHVEHDPETGEVLPPREREPGDDDDLPEYQGND